MLKNDTVPVAIRDIQVAMALLTRLPMPRIPDPAFDRQSAAAWAFPLVGLAVGLIAVATGWLASRLGLPPAAAAGLMLAAMALATGAMHEDGLADTADGFWGGTTAARRLEIMKDSHIGTYGVLALVIVAGLRWVALTALLSQGALVVVLAAAVWSRGLLPVLMAALPNARGSGLGHSVGAPGPGTCAIAVILAAGLCLVLGGAGLVAILGSGLAVLALAAAARSAIGGQTGDVLGAAQQIGEVAFLLIVIARP